MLRHHCRSEQHRRILSCLLECRTKGGLPIPVAMAPSIKVSAVFPNLPGTLRIHRLLSFVGNTRGDEFSPAGHPRFSSVARHGHQSSST